MKNNKTPDFMYNWISLIFIVGLDLTSGVLADLLLGIPFIGWLIFPIAFILLFFVVSIIIFLSEFIETKQFFSSLIKSVVAGIIVVIPTPLTGTIVGVLGTGYFIFRKKK